jgi:hypothetical protein
VLGASKQGALNAYTRTIEHQEEYVPDLHALVGAKAAGKLSVSGDSPVVITGPDQDRELARAVLRGRGLTLTRYPERDKWRRS